MRQRTAAALSLLILAGCAPTLDWRETTFPEAGGLVALFPCKPDRFQRLIPLAGRKVSWAMASCKAGEATYAVSHADMVDPTVVTPALIELRAALARNVGGSTVVVRDVQLTHATANAQSQQVLVTGHGADGTALQAQTLYFVRGTRVFQVTVLAAEPESNAVETFFAGLRLTV